MTTRSIVLSAAALLLVSAVAPAPIGLKPVPAAAQVSGEVAEALAANPAQLQARELRQRIRTLRQAVQSGALSGNDLKAARAKIKALREELQRKTGDAQQAEADDSDDQQTTTQRQQPQQAQQQQAAQQQQKAQRQQEKAQRLQQKAQQQQSQQAQTSQEQPAASADVAAALADSRPSSGLSDDQLRKRIQVLRRAVQSGSLSGAQRRQANAIIKADRDELQSRRQAAQTEEKAAETAQEAQKKAKEPQATEVTARAQALLSDKRPADQLNEEELRRRLTETRAVLATGKLAKADERALRRQLRDDREALRSRVAAKEEKQEREKDKEKPTVEVSTDVNVIIEQQIPSDRLTERQLERRIRILERALKEQRIEQRHLRIANHILAEDRRILRQRLRAERDRRHRHLREARARNELMIDFHIDFRPPPVIFAAEADIVDIEHQLVAPPFQPPPRAYSFQEIATNDEVREAMPGIEIDTLNFDFGSAEVRPEEVEKLDKIAEVIERIVAARPEEVFMIEGHTDAVGSDAANQALSERRANAVMDALVYYYAIDPQNLRTVGLGERFLKIPTEEPEEENRRVTVRRITPLLTGRVG